MTAEPVIFVVDDDEAVRDSLQILLESDGFTVQAFDCGQAFLDGADLSRCGCVLLDVRMPDISGLDLQERLATDRPDIPVVIMTGHGDVPMAVRAMRAGAVDFIEKPFTDTAVLDGIRRALKPARRPNEQGKAAEEAAGRLAGLTPREREVMEGLVAGHPNKVVAYHLGISPRTVEVHRARVMEKAGVRSLPELVRLAITAGAAPSPAGR